MIMTYVCEKNRLSISHHIYIYNVALYCHLTLVTVVPAKVGSTVI